ncbi:MAG: hypothetical protein ABSF09_12335 [Candidatus Bathyarchaeia archaeon]|jgi:hypothetical protein
MGRTIPSWRIVVEEEVEKLKKFRNSLRLEDKLIFEDLLNQCKLYASAASGLASPIKEVPLILSILFAHHKKLAELEKRLNEKTP